jgi:hypothetical protein
LLLDPWSARTALSRKSVVADGAGMVAVRSIAMDGGVCIPVGVVPPVARPLQASTVIGRQ